MNNHCVSSIVLVALGTQRCIYPKRADTCIGRKLGKKLSKNVLDVIEVKATATAQKKMRCTYRSYSGDPRFSPVNQATQGGCNRAWSQALNAALWRSEFYVQFSGHL